MSARTRRYRGRHRLARRDPMQIVRDRFRVADITGHRIWRRVHADLTHPPRDDTRPHPGLRSFLAVGAVLALALVGVIGLPAAAAGGGAAMAAAAAPVPRKRTKAGKDAGEAAPEIPADIPDVDHPATDAIDDSTQASPQEAGVGGSSATSGAAENGDGGALTPEAPPSPTTNAGTDVRSALSPAEGGQPAGEDDGERATAGPGAQRLDSSSSPPSAVVEATDPATVALPPAEPSFSELLDQSSFGGPEAAALAAAGAEFLGEVRDALLVIDPDLMVPDRPTPPPQLAAFTAQGPPLVSDPWLCDGRWVIEPTIWRADVHAFLAVAEQLEPRRYEAWQSGDGHEIRCYGVIPGTDLAVVVRGRTHRPLPDVGPTWLVAEETLHALAEAERIDASTEDSSLYAALNLGVEGYVNDTQVPVLTSAGSSNGAIEHTGPVT